MKLDVWSSLEFDRKRLLCCSEIISHLTILIFIELIFVICRLHDRIIQVLSFLFIKFFLTAFTMGVGSKKPSKSIPLVNRIRVYTISRAIQLDVHSGQPHSKTKNLSWAAHLQLSIIRDKDISNQQNVIPKEFLFFALQLRNIACSKMQDEKQQKRYSRVPNRRGDA